MRRLEELLLLVGAVVNSVNAAGEALRPRGVGPEFAKFYKSADTFTCISNPSIHLSQSQINDDYCDCPDGSDEPGTSACSYLSPLSPPSPSNIALDDVNTTLALPGYYCKNKGHQPAYVPFTNINDGVCDHERCCDGSDEWEGVGGIVCEDRCKEIGKEWRKADEQCKRALGAAVRKKKDLVAEAARLRKEVEDRIQTIGTQIEGAEIKVGELERELMEAERKEKSRVVRAPGKGSRVNVLAGLAKGRIEELRGALVRVWTERDANRERVKELEGILSTFKEEYNPNFNDEGVKRAVRTWEEYAARDKGSDGDAAHDRDLTEIAKADSDNGGIQWEEWEGSSEEESDVEARKSTLNLGLTNTGYTKTQLTPPAVYRFESYLPPAIRIYLHTKLSELREMLVANGILAGSSSSTSTTESATLTAARTALNSARDELNGFSTELSNHRSDLSSEIYGPQDIFRALKGQCVTKDSGEYTYSLCYLDRTTQKPKKGGADTNMGSFVRLDHVTVDEGEIPADGRGLGTGERLALRYENGQGCWNGPARSTTVVLGCAETDEIWRIVEEEKCVYRMEVGSPAVCGDLGGNGDKIGERKKDEL
ncbi:MAG: hypothetical protein M1827_005788 [Pycnora praestabilis]|nr:MAG: hypothetical protein M1827_005788 [Pycnora praestabilis]